MYVFVDIISYLPRIFHNFISCNSTCVVTHFYKAARVSKNNYHRARNTENTRRPRLGGYESPIEKDGLSSTRRNQNPLP